MKIVSVIGARPQFIKAAAVSRVLRATAGLDEILVHTGQHYDENMSEIFFRQLSIPEPDYNLEVGSGSHAYQTGMMLKGIEDILLKEKPDCTLVYGDTNSTIAGALAATKLHIPVAHVEAGLRSFNRLMPEEINRIVTDRISDVLFAPTLTAISNLKNEGLEKQTVFSGDVMYDSVLFYKKLVVDGRNKYKTQGLPESYLLATIHRAENTDNPVNLRNIFQALSQSGHTVVLPVHPRTARLLKTEVNISSNIIIIEPVGYLEMLYLTMHALKVLTDSGGLQKEAYFLGRQCITMRTETEWVETLHDNWNIVTGPDPEKILLAVGSAMPQTPQRQDFGDGKSADIIAEELLKDR
ncbi:MAG: UDP-N-acetylglucosamine 2-epimerase (non-hydrolyzing) [Bacteroidetes bacterium]|nr:UDP-N-acetylglucosamine 2-epimerase (non-hydrolyzing) [Bacteroidota bacterium]